ncbi:MULTISPECIES: AraC family transcriptional regulator [Sphingobacterium]|uniref:Helix-turn-helix domain-containing protein n=1 Tax=Sphingobacterium populi TaxID=1812824 RepID=A0ABW5UG05_9SPHI|nr:AraC family transcriptional regulator [Sphingobacterium sp. CFCC 11742]
MQNEKYPLDFILLNIGYAEHHADWNWKNINSPFARLHLVRKGSAKIHRDGVFHQLKENHLYLTPSHTQHSYACDGEFSLYYIHIYEKLDQKSSIFDRLDFPMEIQSDTLVAMLVDRLHLLNPERELSIYDPSSYDTSSELIKNLALNSHTPLALEIESQAIIKQLLSRFLSGATEKLPHTDERMIRVLDHIHKNLHRVIGIDELAEISFLTKDHLIRAFKKQLGSTPGKYINQKKIEKAQLMIVLENINIQKLAYELGFDNISYFNRLFKKLTGETPSAYRKRQNGI